MRDHSPSAALKDTRKKNSPLSRACSPAVLRPPAPPSLWCLAVVPDPSVPVPDPGRALGPEASQVASGCSRPGRPGSVSESPFSSPSLPRSSSAGTAPWSAARAPTAAGRNSPPIDPREVARRSRHSRAPGKGCQRGTNQSRALPPGRGQDCRRADRSCSSAQAEGCWRGWFSELLLRCYSHNQGCEWWHQLPVAWDCMCWMDWLLRYSSARDCVGYWSFVWGWGRGWAPPCGPGLYGVLDRSQSSPAAAVAASDCSCPCEPSALPEAPEPSAAAATKRESEI